MLMLMLILLLMTMCLLLLLLVVNGTCIKIRYDEASPPVAMAMQPMKDACTCIYKVVVNDDRNPFVSQ